MPREASQVGALLFANHAVRVRDALHASRLVLRRLVGAAAIVGVEPDALVVVAGDGRGAPFAEDVDDLVRPDVVSNQVAQAVDGIRTSPVNVLQHNLEGGEIGVDVGEGSYFRQWGGAEVVKREEVRVLL